MACSYALQSYEEDPLSMTSNYLPDLAHYFVSFKDEDRSLRLSDVLPDVCPFLLQSCIPYLFVFERHGRFSWMEFTQWPNAVFVQCANPKDAIELRICKEENNNEY